MVRARGHFRNVVRRVLQRLEGLRLEPEQGVLRHALQAGIHFIVVPRVVVQAPIPQEDRADRVREAAHEHLLKF